MIKENKDHALEKKSMTFRQTFHVAEALPDVPELLPTCRIKGQDFYCNRMVTVEGGA